MTSSGVLRHQVHAWCSHRREDKPPYILNSQFITVCIEQVSVSGEWYVIAISVPEP